MIDKMWEILTTLTSESEKAALSKCSELGFDPNRGVVSLDESYINLKSASNILRDAIEKRKLIQLPITVQKIIASSLEAIQKYQSSLISGADEVVNLSDAIEKLNTSIWLYGLHNLSDEVLGYHAKLNQLKEMELAATKVKNELEKGIQVKENLEKIVEEAEERKLSLNTLIENATTSASNADVALAQTTESNNKAAALLATIVQNESTSTQLVAGTSQKNAEVLAYEKTIKSLVSDFTQLKSELETNKSTQEQLFKEFEDYRTKINGLLGDANRTGMAASFTSRRVWLLAPMAAWLIVFAVSIFGLIYIGRAYLVPLLNAENFDLNRLPSRLALTAPFIWLGWFSAKQYGFSSRLREDYAYKEASAKSFEGYKREASQVSPEMLKNLLETAIKNLGDNPIRIYSGHENHASPLHELFEKSLKDEKSKDLLLAMLSKLKVGG